ncbi:unnamed protein product (macronuclear) [Paramecium tetraurelia]|uniref:Uncharacterized protein n=1 Tax=Paramecium tetraurelia TaxID=5888 RepID=A0CKZ4_PARTE|nr:uncharacterized protein GSPATT00008008001 [Paramecium tetraurelia]CAK71461.1 unnamed protein product [Paramecium tetraurelia]|eukprot:XP_001438858.1 hypothetical protein (macronuclear) [Paramecium tetraurelia strain d4-2]
MIPANKSPQEVEIFFCYQQAINNLEQGRINDGKEQLKNLLHSKIVQSQENKTIHYATLISLAEICGRSNEIREKCEALRYYHESNAIIEDCWETNRKMAIIFRQIGLNFRALHLTLKALESCQQVQGKIIMYYQVCCLAFLINEVDYFNQYLEKMPDENKLKQQLLELDQYIKESKTTQFVNELLEERNQISKKLEQIPKEYLILDYFYQEYECEIYMDELDLKKFFKKLRKLLINNLHIDEDTEEIHQRDISILLKTVFIVKSKKDKLIPQNKPKEQLEKNVKQRLKQKLNLDLNNKEKFSLQSILQKENSKFIEIMKKCGVNFDSISIYGKNTILHNQQNQETEQKQTKPVNNGQIGQYLVYKLSPSKFYFLNLINQLTELLYKLSDELNFDQEAVEQAQIELVKCYIWVQYFITDLTNDPKIDLKILYLLFNEFKQRIKNEKNKTKMQTIKLKNYQKLILKLNDKLLFQISFKKSQKDQLISQTKEFKMIMSQIHNEFNILKNLPAYCYNQGQLNRNQQLAKLLEFSLPEILEYWEQPIYQIEKGDQVQTQVAKIKNFLKDESKLCDQKETYLILNACIKQLYYRQTKEQCKQTFQLIKPIFEQFFKLTQINSIIAVCLLKLTFIYGAIDEEASQPLLLFLLFYYKKLQSPQKDLFLITTLQLKQINLCKFLETFNLNQLIKDILDLRQKMKQEYQNILRNFTERFQDSKDVQYYLLNYIGEKSGVYGHCTVQKIQMHFETQPAENTKTLAPPEIYSSESEDDYDYISPYNRYFKDIKLTNEQLTEPFKIGSNQYQFSIEKQKYLLSHKLSVNLGDPKISNQIKRVSKELVKQIYSFSTKDLKKSFIVYFFENYYFSPHYVQKELFENEIKFIGYFLPICYNKFSNKKAVHNFANTVILKNIPKKIDSQVYQYATALNQLIFSKQSQQQPPKLNEMKDLIAQQKLQNDYLANIYYLLQLSREDDKNNMYICIAIALNEVPFFWNYLYMKIFNQAYNQLNQKAQPQEIDWFISQKKIQVHLQKFQTLAHLFEYRFIMDLLKAQQRQLEYESQPNEKNYQKVQQAYQFLLSQNQFTIPIDIFDLQHNFRAILLIEKKILRKLRSVPIERIIQSITNYSSINKLIIQMKDKQMNYFYNSAEGEVESISDLSINVYKYLRRFIQSNNVNGLCKLLEIIEIKFPLLMENIKDNEEFQYILQPELRFYKTQLQEKQSQSSNQFIISKDFQQKINMVMMNLCLFFEKIKMRIDRAAPQRYVIEGIYYFCHIQLNNKNLSKEKLENLLQIISLIFSTQNKDLIKYYKKYGEEYSEQDEVLRQYYHHDLIFQYLKQKVVKIVVKIYILSKKWNELVELLEVMPKQFEIRGYQICLALIENWKLLEDPQLLKDAICQIDYFLKKNIQYFHLNENKDYNNMLLKFYDTVLSKEEIIKDAQSEIEKIYQAKKFMNNQIKILKKFKRDTQQNQEPQNFIEIG